MICLNPKRKQVEGTRSLIDCSLSDHDPYLPTETGCKWKQLEPYRVYITFSIPRHALMSGHISEQR
jgi:hypothetical protein